MTYPRESVIITYRNGDEDVIVSPSWKNSYMVPAEGDTKEMGIRIATELLEDLGDGWRIHKVNKVHCKSFDSPVYSMAVEFWRPE